MSLEVALREAVRAEVREALAATPTWTWVVWSAWARSQTHARRLAARESIRTTRLGRDLYGHRDDLDALAAHNAGAAAPEGDDHDPDVVALFGGRHG